jgi:hypothetical protein
VAQKVSLTKKKGLKKGLHEKRNGRRGEVSEKNAEWLRRMFD